MLVAGGAGAVGHAAIQLAVWAGAEVIATVSSHEKAALARAAGAHHTVNYRDADAADQISALAPAGIDHIVSQVTEKMLYTNNGLYIHTRLKGQGNGLRFLSFVQYCSP